MRDGSTTLWSPVRRAFVLVGSCCLAGGLLVACGGDDDDATTATTVAATATTMTMSSTSAAPAGSDAPATTAAPAGTTAGSAAGELPTEVTVDIKDFAFGPEAISIAVGGTITFTNSDDQQHTATAAGMFDTGAIAPGESATVTVDTAGDIAYICSFHPFMKGSVTVG